VPVGRRRRVSLIERSIRGSGMARARRNVRYWAALSTLMMLLTLATAACTSPKTVSSACSGKESDGFLRTIATHLTAEGTLRNGRVVPSLRRQTSFVSAELHRKGDARDIRGDILTWESGSDGSFRSVDVNAERDSTWPRASTDLRNAQARQSRGCVYPLRGKIACAPTGGLPGGVRAKCRPADEGASK
jgi:hypothetical protein